MTTISHTPFWSLCRTSQYKSTYCKFGRSSKVPAAILVRSLASRISILWARVTSAKPKLTRGDTQVCYNARKYNAPSLQHTFRGLEEAWGTYFNAGSLRKAPTAILVRWLPDSPISLHVHKQTTNSNHYVCSCFHNKFQANTIIYIYTFGETNNCISDCSCHPLPNLRIYCMYRIILCLQDYIVKIYNPSIYLCYPVVSRNVLPHTRYTHLWIFQTNTIS